MYQPDKDSVRYTGGRDIDALRKYAMGITETTTETETALTHSDGLFDITASSFDKHISQGHHFIKFYAPWCGHCKRMEPAWNELAKTHAPSEENTDDVKIGRVCKILLFFFGGGG